MKLPRSCVFVVSVMLLALWPAPAHAESDMLGWLGELSGPGPFKLKGLGVEGHAWCFPKDVAISDKFWAKVGNCVLEDADKIRPVTIAYQLSRATTGANQLFKDDPTDLRNVNEDTYSALLMYRANAVLDVGAGISAVHFSGDEDKAKGTAEFGFWRLGLTPARVVFTPFGALKASTPRSRALQRVIHLQVESVLIPSGFTGADFGNTKTAYKASSEFQTRLHFLIDIGVIVRAIKQ